MSMPRPFTAWPPQPYGRAWDLMRDRHTWWEGDPDKIAAMLGSKDPRPAGRPSQYRGGMVGKASRSIFGAPPPVGGRRAHVPIAGDLAMTSATLMAGEPPRLIVPEGAANEAAQQRIDRIFNTPEFHAGLLEGEEFTAALGDSYGRVAWDTDYADEAWIEFVDGDRAWPIYRKGILTGVVFWEDLPGGDKDTAWRHLEFHGIEGGVGFIEHALFLGKDDNLGQRVPLTEHENTAGIPVDAESRILTGTRELTACHIPNRSPNPIFRTEPLLRRLGKSDLTPAVMGLMAHVDDAFTSLARDVRLGKARIMVSEHLTHTAGPGTGGVFDVDQEAFAIVGGAPNDNPVIEAHQFAIRVQEHMQVAEAYIRQILTSVGYSPLQFGLKDDATASMTATEIEAKDRGSSATKSAKSLRRRAALSRMARAAIEVDAAVYGTGAEVSEQIGVEYQPAVTPTPEALANTMASLRNARAASTLTLVGMLHPDWDKADVEAEAQRILDEDGGGQLFDPLSFRPDETFEPEPDVEPNDDPDLTDAA